MPSVYESYTYDQLKELSDDQKVIALKELKTIYPDNKDLAKHLDTAHIAVSNMVGKYLEGKSVGRKKMTEEEKAQAKAERELKKAQESQKQSNQENKAEDVIKTTEQTINEVNEVKDEEKTIPPIKEESQVKTPESKSNSFSIKLDKNMNGEEAISRLSGIANSLLKENQYKVSLVIEEV